ncbi:MAG: CBS domain-containing protein [Nitrospira sp.]|nr:CBS domain-containing protein [Nitrospira sp.]MCB9711594.1 CBS domain-containing protein [Nitrospiraceae bacterium]MDR4487285.1 CBS domain-containing protein [Nitrospirales bacterium]MCA9463888.1 CBS domain-containing protein [Nitrospira sp.]MCA9476117.1 CBS domain-containing protein [Nitrospira sp.]
MKHAEVVRVKDVMKIEFDLIHGIETVADALRAAKHLETECMLVNRRHDDDEYGIVLLSDIAKKVLGADRAADRVNVYEIMSKPVVSVDPDMDIRYCARLFERFGLTLAPVIQGRTVVGVVSYRDIVLRGVRDRL